MKAARFYGKGDIRIDEVEEPTCKEGQIKIKPAFVGICGTGMFSSSSETGKSVSIISNT